ncbi:dTDP-4-dehydrorhamnose reductase [Paraburkholderia sp. CNPSo 3076]|uniref:dTDP-4-dehydrorhamnose reductase n=1 Tax=Paraburkholderia sp. CNPSo 3076 TaxID=2940936 RepID=UPI00225C1CFC|nr:dTDP-4-dehydrorhamnose reductase [Paraburkholderia sp. CNPSo 3076]MCX5539963.1 dTDP-4-dehydrorhamnose reductase [Paraburkholderia sp. CNPSo 3076]
MNEQRRGDASRATPDRPVILVTGANGQVGYEAVRALQGLGTIVALDRNRLDLTRLDDVRHFVRETKPALIVNAAAYTAVDRAESDAATAHLVNAQVPYVLAEEANDLGSLLIHYSTDYVFDGSKPDAYVETDEPNPLNVYGRTKLEGERAIAHVGGKYLIFRTSWVYGARGRNFMLTMLKFAREGRKEITVVDDQIGAPTWSRTIAACATHIAARYCANDADASWWTSRAGVYHLTAAGATSWYGFARAIFQAVNDDASCVQPIKAESFAAAARRPSNSRLCCDKLANVFGLHVPAWEGALAQCLEEAVC